MKIAVIGMGSIGQRHYRNLKALGYSQVRGWDVDPVRGTPVDWPWKPDVVLICTPPDSHTLLGRQAVWYGDVKGLFIEKPFSDKLGYEESDLLRDAEHFGVVTMVGCNWRFRSGMHDLLFRPGSLHMWANIPIPEERRTTPLWDIGVHLIDIARWSGHTHYQATYNYAEPYNMTIKCGDKHRTWRSGNNAMYLSEMRHFMRCVKTGEPTGNDFRFVAETLKLALGMREI